MNRFWQNLRFAARLLVKKPSFTIIAVATLALGIGANAAIFSVVYGLLYSSLPFPDSDRLVRFYEAYPERGWSDVSITPGNFNSWKAQSESFEEMALFDGISFNLTEAGEPVRVGGVKADANLFSVLAREPILGRTFTSEEAAQVSERVAVISYPLWQRQFGGRSEIVGETIRLDDRVYTVIGIMPPDFYFASRGADVWVPIRLTTDEAQSRENHSYGGIGRLRKDVTLEQARGELTVISKRLADEFPETNSGWRAVAMTIREVQFDSGDRLLFTILYLAVGFVVLIACVNVANLLLARAANREQEVGVRMALGAGRGQLVGQLLVESALLALLGGIAGLLIAYGGIQALLTIAPDDAANLEKIGLNAPVVAYTMFLALATGFVFGLLPAIQTSRVDVQATLKQSGRASWKRSRHRMLKTLVVTEVALAMILLTCGGLMVRSYSGLASRSRISDRAAPHLFDQPSRAAILTGKGDCRFL